MARPLHPCRAHVHRLERPAAPAQLVEAAAGLWTCGQREALPTGSTGAPAATATHHLATHHLSGQKCQPCIRSKLSTIDPVAHAARRFRFVGTRSKAHRPHPEALLRSKSLEEMRFQRATGGRAAFRRQRDLERPSRPLRGASRSRSAGDASSSKTDRPRRAWELRSTTIGRWLRRPPSRASGASARRRSPWAGAITDLADKGGQSRRAYPSAFSITRRSRAAKAGGVLERLALHQPRFVEISQAASSISALSLPSAKRRGERRGQRMGRR